MNLIRMTPRKFFALALLGDRVFVHGGECNGNLADFYFLDMKTLTWTQIDDDGIPYAFHTFSPYSEKQFVAVGGLARKHLSNKVRLFDAETLTWKEEAPLPREFGGGGGGLAAHRAVELPKENGGGGGREGAVIICLGGCVDSDAKTHPDYLLLFDVSY